MTCQVFGKYMLEKKKGTIINIASLAGHRGILQRAGYCASKAGVIGLTKTMDGCSMGGMRYNGKFNQPKYDEDSHV